MVRLREFDTERVLDAATEVFWRQGFEGTSAQSLCDATGLGRGSLYNAFTSKRELYLLVLRRYSTLGLTPMGEILDGSGTARERLRAMVVRGIDIDLGDAPRKGCLAVNAATELADRDAEVREIVTRHFVKVEEAIAGAVAQGCRSGEFDASLDVDVATKTVMSVYYGLRVLTKVPQSREALLAVVDAVLDSL
ncbi:TetR/AcrR family transcriptional regulator [Brevibacterium casei]|uniref:TetR/AcrR family transcriptional regulator n=1 Tax=Brevibacterium casei TaxID=33889 RepID=UPI003F81D364